MSVVPALWAQEKAPKKLKAKTSEVTKPEQKKVAKVNASEWKFDAATKKSLREFYKQYAESDLGLPSGIAKKVAAADPLPSGWRDQLSPGWKIDEAWQQRLHIVSMADLPLDFKVSHDVGVYLLGDRILRVDEGNKALIDAVRIPTIKLK
ncbi:hypothetical protein [Rubritalea marina]|uniref:hypothetical protein n=1 Tax=Rubritalea marina TaxID=361055 RepID=UPI0012EA5DBA|nr:hypothetical protein [Rubritalea marina]